MKRFYISFGKDDKKIVDGLLGKTLLSKKGFIAGKHPFDLRVKEEKRIFVEIKPKSEFFLNKNNELCVQKIFILRILNDNSEEFSENCLITLLGEIKDTSEFYLRRKIIKHIKDQNVLFNVALIDTHYDIRAEAIDGIEDDCDLIKIFEETGVLFLRTNLVRKIKNKKFLKDIVLTDPDYEVRRVALEKLDDKDLLVEVAKHDESWCVRIAAIKKIKDKEILNWVIENDEEECVRETAKTRL